jgi:GNAT superfamily N-acetyltransferase
MKALLRLATQEDAPAIATVLIESRLAFLPFAPSARPQSRVRQWVTEHLVPTGRVHVAEVDGKVVAAMATSDDGTYFWIDQLYVLPGFEAQGIGSQLLQVAHKNLGRPILLHTFQANSGARRFYERHGYQAIKFTDGHSNEEKCPDVLYQLEGDATEA